MICWTNCSICLAFNVEKGFGIIMRTVTDVNTVNQLLTYSKQAEAGIHQKAIQMLLGEGKHTYLLQESGKTINVDAKIK